MGSSRNGEAARAAARASVGVTMLQGYLSFMYVALVPIPDASSDKRRDSSSRMFACVLLLGEIADLKEYAYHASTAHLRTNKESYAY